MEACSWNYSYMNGISILLLSGPVCWGIYEIRKLRKLLENYKTTIDTLSPKVISTTNMINDIAKANLEEYPFIMKLNLLADKANRILH